MHPARPDARSVRKIFLFFRHPVPLKCSRR
jgi:hypothetical protein